MNVVSGLVMAEANVDSLDILARDGTKLVDVEQRESLIENAAHRQ